MISSDPYTSIPVNIYTASLMALITYGAKGETAAIAANREALYHLTDEPAQHGYRAFVVAVHNMSVLEGVWYWDDNGVIIEWSIGKTMHYKWDLWKANTPTLHKIKEREQKKQKGDNANPTA